MLRTVRNGGIELRWGRFAGISLSPYHAAMYEIVAVSLPPWEIVMGNVVPKLGKV